MPRFSVCPLCGQRFQVPDSAGGRHVKCPGCRVVVPVTGESPRTNPASAPPARPKAAPPQPQTRPKAPPSPAEHDVLEVVDDAPTPTARPPQRPAKAPPPAAHDVLDVVEEATLDVVESEPLEVLPADEPPPRPPRQRKGSVAPADCLLLRRREFLIVARSSSALTLSYTILDADTEKELAFGEEEAGAGGLTLQVMGADKASFPCTVTVYDARSDADIFRVHRPAFRKFMGINAPPVEICDGEDRLLGSFQTKPLPAIGSFWIFDAHDRELAELDGQWHPRPDYCFRDANGAVIARVTGEGEPCRLFNAAFSWCKKGGQILLSLEDDRANEPEAKLILVATTMSMELLIASFRMRSR
jgi:hypothetical protein